MIKNVIILSIIINLFFAISTTIAQTTNNQNNYDYPSNYVIPDEIEDMILYQSVVNKVMSGEEYQEYASKAMNSSRFLKKQRKILEKIETSKYSNPLNNKVKNHIKMNAKKTISIF